MTAELDTAIPLETLKETNRGFDLAVIAFTKGQLSPDELWAECDWAATSYERHGAKDARKTVFARYREIVADWEDDSGAEKKKGNSVETGQTGNFWPDLCI